MRNADFLLQPRLRVTPTTMATKTKVAATTDGAVKKKAHKSSRGENYKLYITRVLKVMHPDASITREAVGVVNSFVNDMFGRIASDAGRITTFGKRSTLTSRDLGAAVAMNFPDSLAKHARAEGAKALEVVKSTATAKKGAKAAAA